MCDVQEREFAHQPSEARWRPQQRPVERAPEMNNIAVMGSGLGADLWYPKVDDTVGVASYAYVATSRASGAMGTGLAKVKLAWHLRTLSSKLSSLLDGIQTGVESSMKAGKASKKAKQEPVTREKIESAIRSLEYLYDVISRIYAKAQEHQLTNYSTMAASLRSIHRRSEELLDLADWLQSTLSQTSSDLDKLYAKARKDLAEGNVHDLAQVR